MTRAICEEARELHACAAYPLRPTGPLAGGAGEVDRMAAFHSNEQPVWVDSGLSRSLDNVSVPGRLESFENADLRT
jgi:hypothetical protein